MLCLFFLNYQFIIWGTKPDHGSYNVTMYRTAKTTWKIKERKEEKRIAMKRNIKEKYPNKV